ncbi:MAG TPA: hypothetical protein DF480_04815 [Clostridiales bacterium]|nr:hypothetical protein [Clostridiales bacterium]
MMSNKWISGRLGRPYTIFALLLLLMTLAIWLYFWTGLASYEAGIPKNLMDHLVQSMEKEVLEEGSCVDVLVKYGKDIPGLSAQENGILLANLLRDKEVTYRKITGWNGSGDMAYHILADGEEAAIVTLLAKERGGVLGLALYKVDSLYGMQDLTVMAAPKVQVYAGDLLLTGEHLTDRDKVPEDLRGLADFPENEVEIPKYSIYTLEGLFWVPPIRGVDGARSTDGVYVAPNCAVVGLPLDAELMEDVEERAVTITHKYSHYMSDDLGWSGFKGYLVDTAPVYDRLRTLEVNWYTLHDSNRFENMQILDWIMYTDHLISLRMTYDYIIVGQGKVTTYDTDLTYYLALESDGKWRIAEMIVN